MIKPFSIKAVLFDFDGTLTKPGALDFRAIKQSLGCPLEMLILEYIEQLDEAERPKALTVLSEFESAAARASEPNRGAEALVCRIRSLGLPMGIITRNSLAAVHLALENFRGVTVSDFKHIGSRDDPVAPKPSPEGIFFAAEKLGVRVDEILVVGDYWIDVQAGQEAGAVTVFLDNGKIRLPEDIKSHFTVSNLSEVDAIVQLGRPLPAGKLSNEVLERFLTPFQLMDSSVLIGPGVGEDVAAVLPEPSNAIVLKSDPITFVADAVDQYVIEVNANDIATAGATPRWFLTTLLFPVGTTPSAIGHVMQSLADRCKQRRIVLCGGHTEVTDAVTRPVVSGMMVGTVPIIKLIDKKKMAPGDHILLTKKVALEGTAILAREFGKKLLSLGGTGEEIRAAGPLLSQISILEEARLAAETDGIHGLHDITEGGVATALQELSIAGNHQLQVHMDAVPIHPLTEKFCNLLDLDPLGLIGSGSLLIVCTPGAADIIMEKVQAAGIDIACIGRVLGNGRGVEALQKGQPVPWPVFDRDELSKLF